MSLTVRFWLILCNGLYKASWWAEERYLAAYRRWESSAPARLYRRR